MIDLDFILTLLTITGIISSWFYVLIIKPLRDTTNLLQRELEKLQGYIEEAEKDRRNLDSRLSTLEALLTSLQQRVQNLEDIWKK